MPWWRRKNRKVEVDIDTKKEILLATLPAKIVKKIADTKGYEYEDMEDARREIAGSMSLKAIGNYAKISRAQLGRGVREVNDRNVKKVIDGWRIGKHGREKDYQNELGDLLYRRFGRENVVFERGENKADIVVGDEEKFPIELKYNFDIGDRARIEYRLGQYWKEYGNKTFLVICGIKARDNGWADFKTKVYPKFKNKIHLMIREDKEITAE